jgi:hypothetical protein
MQLRTFRSLKSKGQFDPQLNSRTCRRRVEGNVSNEFGVASEQRDSKRMERPMKEIFTAIAFAVLLTAVPALAADTSTNNKPASSTSSGPGVKGAPGNKNGPAAQPNSMDKAGSSSGTADTQPSQDAKGVKGAPGNKSGPAEKPDTTGK